MIPHRPRATPHRRHTAHDTPGRARHTRAGDSHRTAHRTGARRRDTRATRVAAGARGSALRSRHGRAPAGYGSGQAPARGLGSPLGSRAAGAGAAERPAGRPADGISRLVPRQPRSRWLLSPAVTTRPAPYNSSPCATAAVASTVDLYRCAAPRSPYLGRLSITLLHPVPRTSVLLSRLIAHSAVPPPPLAAGRRPTSGRRRRRACARPTPG